MGLRLVAYALVALVAAVLVIWWVIACLAIFMERRSR